KIKYDHCGNQPVPKPNTSQTFSAAMIFGDGLECYAPPEIAVDLHVPFVPPAVGRIAPALFLEHLKDCPQQIVAIPALFAPKNTATQASRRSRAFRQMFVPPNHVGRCPFESQPGEIARKSANKRLDKRQHHHE